MATRRAMTRKRTGRPEAVESRRFRVRSRWRGAGPRGEKRAPSPGLEGEELGEASCLEFGLDHLGRDRGLRAAGKAENRAPSRCDDACQLVDQRNRIHERND